MSRIVKSLFAVLVVAAFALPGHAGETSATKLDLNKATVEELVKLPRIGPAVAKRIVEYRQQNGGFRKAEDLIAVRGIGAKSFAAIKDLVMVGGDGAKPVAAK